MFDEEKDELDSWVIPDRRRELLEEYLKQANAPDWRVLDGLFDKQNGFARDTSKRKVAQCSRRSGKTFSVPRMLVHSAHTIPESDNLYVTLNRSNAKQLVWRPLHWLARRHRLDIKFNHTDLIAELDNGSTIKVTGASDRTEIEKMRGFRYAMAVIDEAQSFGSHIEPLIDDVISPALFDFDGTLAITGTPGPVNAGFFFDITNNPDKYGYSLHKWTVSDNSEFPRWAGEKDWRRMALEFIEEECQKKYGGDRRNPKFIREYLGEWCQSDDALLYHILHEYLYDDMPKWNKRDVSTVLGIDLGWHDNTAFVVVGYNRVQQRAFEVECRQAKELVVSDIADITGQLVNAYDPEKIVIDGHGEGKIIIKSLASEIGLRYNIPVQAAEKQKKASFIRLLDSDLLAGKVLLKRRSELWRQMRVLQWDDKFQREVEGQPCDLADAFLYAFRECKHWAVEEFEEPPPKPGTPEWTEWQVRKWEHEDFEQEDTKPEPDWF